MFTIYIYFFFSLNNNWYYSNPKGEWKLRKQTQYARNK